MLLVIIFASTKLLCNFFFVIDDPYYPVRLVSSNNKESKGCVQFFHQATWGSLCDVSAVSISDSNVICRTLGFNGANLPSSCSSYPSISYYSQPVWLSNIDCSEEMSSVTDCSHSEYGLHLCNGHTQDVGIDCKGIYTNGELNCVTISFPL